MITVKYSKAAIKDVNLRARLEQPLAIARATADHISARTAKGQFATPAKPYEQRVVSLKKVSHWRNGKRSAAYHALRVTADMYYISPAYAVAAGVGNQTRWEGSAAFHQAIHAHAGHATGLLAKSLSVRNYGNDAAIIEYAGSSLGGSSVRTAITKRVTGTYEIALSSNDKVRARQVREYSRDEGGDVKYRRKPKLVRNAEKASAVFKHSKIGLLQPTDAETAAQWSALANHAGVLVASSFGGQPGPPAPEGNRALFNAILRELK